MRLPPRREMLPNPLHCVWSNSVFPIKLISSLDLLDGTPESPQEHCHKFRRTMMSLQESKIFQGAQINWKRSLLPLHRFENHPALHIIQDKWLDFL